MVSFSMEERRCASMTLSAVIRGGNANDDDEEESIMSNNEKEVEGIAAVATMVTAYPRVPARRLQTQIPNHTVPGTGLLATTTMSIDHVTASAPPSTPIDEAESGGGGGEGTLIITVS